MPDWLKIALEATAALILAIVLLFVLGLCKSAGMSQPKPGEKKPKPFHLLT